MDTETAGVVARFLRRVQRRDSLPGVAVAVVETDGETATTWAEGFGARDAAGNRPVSPDTMFAVGGVTQPLTAAAVRQLSAAGLCDLADPVTDHVDVGLPRGPDGEPIRLRHLLAHTSGLPAVGLRETLLARRLRIGTDTLPLADWDDVCAHLRRVETADLLAPPGERVARCDAGYVLLGRVVRSCTGRSYAAYVDEHLLEPLAADRATFDDTQFSMDDDHATQYLLEDGEPTAASLPTDERLRPATGLLASVRHLAALARLGLGDGRYDGREVVACGLGGDTVGGDTPDGSASGSDATEPSPPPGWRRREICGRTTFERAGDVAVSGGYVGYCPATGTGVALAANAVPDYPLSALGAGVFGATVGTDPVAAAPTLARRRRLDRLTGRYESVCGVRRAHVTREDGRLTLAADGPLTASVRPLSPVTDEPGAAPDDAAVAAADAGATHETATDEETATDDGVYRFTICGGEGAATAQFDTTGETTTLTVGRRRYRRAE